MRKKVNLLIQNMAFASLEKIESYFKKVAIGVILLSLTTVVFLLCVPLEFEINKHFQDDPLGIILLKIKANQIHHDGKIQDGNTKPQN